jgi:predicted MFS family arabinose efflux permease
LTTARTLRGFGAGALSVVFAIDLAKSGYSPVLVGAILGLAMGAAAAWAIWIPGRMPGYSLRGSFVLGAAAVAAGGFLLWYDLASPWAILPALLLGGIVAGGSDISPLGALEQGALSDVVSDQRRTRSFAAYNLAGYAGTAIGALAAGPLSAMSLPSGGFPAGPRDVTFLLYALVGLALVPTYLRLSSPGALRSQPGKSRRLSPEHRGPILRLSALFTVDALGGGMTANALVAYFLLLRFGAAPETIGIILSLANVAAGLSLLLAVPLARRFGLINTMVFTHIPSSLLLILFAFTPSVLWAGLAWVARAALSQMDVPTRQSYTQAIVPRGEGAAAAGYTTAARSTQALGSPVSGALFAAGGVWLASPFAIAGAIKIAYDLAVYGTFRRLRPPEETAQAAPPRVRDDGRPTSATLKQG